MFKAIKKWWSCEPEVRKRPDPEFQIGDKVDVHGEWEISHLYWIYCKQKIHLYILSSQVCPLRMGLSIR